MLVHTLLQLKFLTPYPALRSDRIAKAAVDRGRLAVVARLRHGLQIVPIEQQSSVAQVWPLVVNHRGRMPAPALAQRMRGEVRSPKLLPAATIDPRRRRAPRIMGCGALFRRQHTDRTVDRRPCRHVGGTIGEIFTPMIRAA